MKHWRNFRDLPWIMQAGAWIAVAIVLMLVAGPARADLVVRNRESGAELRLLDTQCSHGGTLGHIKPEWRAKFKNLRYRGADGQLHYGCWMQRGDTAIVMMEDGSGGGLPMAKLHDPSV